MSDLWLKWNSQLELLSSLDNFLETESFVDVTIAVEGHLLKAHRVVLCASSRYLNSILRSNTAPHPIIFMRDVKFVEMKTILDFIYKGEACVAQENIQGVLKTADALKITGLSSISWTESPMNCVQVDEASQCDIPNCQAESKPSDNLNVQREAQELLPKLNDKSLSSSSGYQSLEEGSEQASKKQTNVGADTQEHIGKLTENCEATKVAHVSTLEDGETLMVLEAPPNISIASVPAAPARPKPTGRQYTKEDLKKRLTRCSYLDMLELYALPQLPPQTIFQQGGLLPHFCYHVRNHLDREMAGRWIGRGIAWPPRSPDLIPLDFCL